ncbi:MAG: DUF305 domain-containing protein [Candidatus Saccharimonadales bacterium]
MENKNQAIIIGLLALIVGLLFGYFFGANNMPHRGFFSNESMYEEMGEHMYGDEIVDGDGAMMHAMDEMMLVGRGQTGEAYEEAWLKGMVVHHLGAINMAEELLKQTDRPELVSIANDIIESQSMEVEQMKEWLNVWFNEN